MLKTKIYLYDSTKEADGYRGTDYSAYVLQGNSDTEDITQKLDNIEITLQGLSTKTPFSPGTKFVIDKTHISDSGVETIYATYHMCVEEDVVMQPIMSDNGYFVHNITLYEASVIAQKRLCDNISATYNLKDVSLQEHVAFHDRQAQFVNTKSEFDATGDWGEDPSVYHDWFRYGKYFEFVGKIEMETQDGTIPQPTKYYRDVAGFGSDGTYKAKFSLPVLNINYGINGLSSFQKIGNASIDWTIEQYSLNGIPEKTWRGTVRSNSSFTGTDYVFSGILPNDVYNKSTTPPEELKKHWIVECSDLKNAFVRQYTEETTTTPVYKTDLIDILPDKIYTVSVSLHNYENAPPQWVLEGVYDTFSAVIYNGFPTKMEIRQPAKINPGTSEKFYQIKDEYLTTENTTASTSFQTYSIATKQILFQSSTAYSALSLINKAVMNSGTYDKVDGVYSGDINARENDNDNGKLLSPAPFYVDPAFLQELSITAVVENFYNQKNLWEILCEVGLYIHAIPEIRFGENDKFMITFNRLGRTDEKQKRFTRNSVMNFVGIENYISSCSSYISNMVQLGGQIEEWTAAKTTQESPLVFNDTCAIVVSKPIIELLKIEVKSTKAFSISDGTSTKSIAAGAIADMTSFVFERNIYKCLSIDTKVEPNVGYSLYYDLGSKSIEGCDYRSPTINSGDLQSDYAIKKAIFTAFWGAYLPTPSGKAWSELCVNDFVFRVVYRTKDNVRQNQSRPDIRKYLVASKFDKYPQNWQFNNQQDTLVDSQKFGNMVFGKLIRTGNLTYKTSEWHDETEYDQLRHKGELYRLDDGDLYYVSQVTHTNYTGHIVSDIEFSKDYNELSPIIGIPSEPRFYEISEQSQIARDYSINDFLLVSTDVEYYGTSRKDIKDFTEIKNLIFDKNTFPKFALTAFKGDKDVDKTGERNAGEPFLYKEILSPISAYSSQNTLTYAWDMLDNFSAGDNLSNTGYKAEQKADNTYRSLQAVQYTDTFGRASLLDYFVIKDLPDLTTEQVLKLPESPVTAKYNENTATKVSLSSGVLTISGSSESMYIGETIFLSGGYSATVTEINAPNATLTTKNPLAFGEISNGTVFTYYSVEQDKVPVDSLTTEITNVVSTFDQNINGRGRVLLKDCRETISVNYNLQMISDSDRFVFSPFLFAQNKVNTKLVLLSEEVNKLSFGYIKDTTIIRPFNKAGTQMSSAMFDLYFYWLDYGFVLDIPTIIDNVNDKHFDGSAGFEQVKAIAVVYDTINAGQDNPGVPFTANNTKFIIARNITGEETQNAWYFYQPKEILFRNKQ